MSSNIQNLKIQLYKICHMRHIFSVSSLNLPMLIIQTHLSVALFYLCSKLSVLVLLYPLSFMLLSCRSDGKESHGDLLCPWGRPWPEPNVELPERHPSECLNHWALLDSPMHEAHLELKLERKN